MKLRIFITIIGLFILIGVIGGIKGLQIGALIAFGQNFQEPPAQVNAVEVNRQNWERTIKTVGAFEAIDGVLVAADLPGKLADINFTSGTDVEAGTILARQDVAVERAQLREAEATLALARLERDRAAELLTRKLGSQAEFDRASATLDEAVARRQSIQATIDRKTIKAPFSGRLGIRQADLGQSLSEGDTLVTLQTLDPIYVNFVLPQRYYPYLSNDTQVRVITDAVVSNGKALPLYGRISSINPEVDENTRNIAVQATLPNPDGKVLPGMSNGVEVILPDLESVLAIPQTAVLNAAYGDSVFIIADGDSGGKTLQQQFIRLGRRLGDLVAVESGLTPGQQIVSTGVFKLRNGQQAVIDNALQPDYDAQPTPENR